MFCGDVIFDGGDFIVGDGVECCFVDVCLSARSTSSFVVVSRAFKFDI